MLKTLIAHTTEIDDIELAVDNIKSQLSPDNLATNSVGIITCHFEFIHSGVVKAISDALPFEVLGVVTTEQATNAELGNFLLTVMVITGNNVEFVLKATPTITDNAHKQIEDAYIEASSHRTDKPALVLAYVPLMMHFSANEFVDLFSQITNNEVPCFGTVSIDATDTFLDCFVCMNGEVYLDRIVMLLIYADITPRFFLATISQEKILPNSAQITKSSGVVLMEVNGHSVGKYFADLGLADATGQYATAALPFVLNYEDGTPPVSRVFIGKTPENYAICAGIIPEGSTMSIGVFDKEDVLLTTGGAVKKALDNAISTTSCMLMYSCVTRNMSLGGEAKAEMELVRDIVGEKLPFVMAYSNGEICPMEISDVKAINRFHNNTFIICLF